VLAATDAPEEVSAIMLLGPFVRDVPQKWWQKAAFGAMLMPPWGKGAWVSYYRKNMYPGAKPPDFDEYVDALSQNLSESGRFASFRAISGSSHAESGRRLDQVTQPALVVMGTADPDFPDPVVEANEIADIMGADVVWSQGSGHYPQAETPELVAGELIALVGRTGAIGSPPPE
jgi:pimeloyl-ACP methyl ester carboxylesterase